MTTGALPNDGGGISRGDWAGRMLGVAITGAVAVTQVRGVSQSGRSALNIRLVNFFWLLTTTQNVTPLVPARQVQAS